VARFSLPEQEGRQTEAKAGEGTAPMGILPGCSDDHTRDFAENFREIIRIKTLIEIWPELKANAGLAFHRIDVRI